MSTAAAKDTKVADKTVEVITEADLLKSITDLETKKVEEKVDPPVPTVKVAEDLNKSLADTIKDKGSAALQQVLNVSDTLREFANLMGVHVEGITSPMAKAIQAGAERDLAFLTVMKDLKKSIDDNTAAIAKLGGEPLAPKTPTVKSTELLNKSLTVVDNKDKQPPNAAQIKKEIGIGLSKLVKSLPMGSSEASQAIRAAIQFESTGKITDEYLNAAKAQLTPKAA